MTTTATTASPTTAPDDNVRVNSRIADDLELARLAILTGELGDPLAAARQLWGQP